MYIAKPNLNNTAGMKEFVTKAEAANYLEEYTGHSMGYEINKSYKKQLISEGVSKSEAHELSKEYDWELIDKIYEV